MDRFTMGLSRIVTKRWFLVIIVCLLLVVAAILGARSVTMATGARTIVSPQSEVYRDFERYSENFGSDPIAVVITAEDMPQLLENLPAMDRLEAELNQTNNILSATGPAFAIKQVLFRQTGSLSLPAEPSKIQAIVVDPATGQVRPQFAKLFPQGKHAIIRVTPKGNLEQEGREVLDDVRQAVQKASFNGLTTSITGVPAVSAKMEDMMRTSMRNMILLASLLMLVVLALIFNVRGLFVRRWLSLGVVLVGIVYTFGVMGVVGVPMTMVSMAVFPILIGLGVDYSIQFHNRYDEAVRRGESSAAAIAISLRYMAPATGIALFATALGFVALLVSPVTMIRDFGRMLLIGVSVCYLTAMFLLLSILYARDRRVISTRNSGAANPVNWLERRLRGLATVVIRHPMSIVHLLLAHFLLRTSSGYPPSKCYPHSTMARAYRCGSAAERSAVGWSEWLGHPLL